MDADNESKSLQPSEDATTESVHVEESSEAVAETAKPGENSDPPPPPEERQSPLPVPPVDPADQTRPDVTDSNQSNSGVGLLGSANREPRETNDKKKDDEKLGIYKALAIKLKKELVKSRDELQKLRDESQKECNCLRDKVDSLEKTLESERHANSSIIATLEAKVRSLKQQLESAESDLQSLQSDFESYKVRASQIMQQNKPMQSHSNKTFEEDRYRQLKELNNEQTRRILDLESQLSTSLERHRELEKEGRMFQQELELIQEKVALIKTLDSKCETLSRENENLKLALKQFRSKLKEPSSTNTSLAASSGGNSDNCEILASQIGRDTVGEGRNKNSISNNIVKDTAAGSEKNRASQSPPNDDRLEENPTRLSPSASIKDDSQTNSSSSFDGSTSGYVHIKPTTFEIISRSSVLEDAQNQIDNLTKNYLDSENTNSLLSEQVRALKEEIRRLQRASDRMELAENLEYLKNVVFKFLSLDSNQAEQKQRLVPVLSTVLKLSPDETAKLNSLATTDKTSMASSFFKL